MNCYIVKINKDKYNLPPPSFNKYPHPVQLKNIIAGQNLQYDCLFLYSAKTAY